MNVKEIKLCIRDETKTAKLNNDRHRQEKRSKSFDMLEETIIQGKSLRNIQREKNLGNQ